jgi:hypothetical protein
MRRQHRRPTDAAVKAGATREELIAVLSVAIAVNAGAALVYSAPTLDAFTAKGLGAAMTCGCIGPMGNLRARRQTHLHIARPFGGEWEAVI